MRCALVHASMVAFLGGALVMPAVALDLKTAYQAALVYDAELLAAKAGLEESEEGVPVARAALLPQLSYSAQKNRADTTTSFLDSARPDVESGKYDSGSSVLNFRQALFRKPAWEALQGAKAQAGAAGENYAKEAQNAALRVVSSYLEVLATRESVTLAKNQTRAMEAWLTLAEKFFKAGRGTRTDIEDARSRRDLSKARETEANMFLFSATRNFAVVSGMGDEEIPDTNPRMLNPDQMLVGDKTQWLQRIEDSSPDIQSLRKQLEVAQAGVAQAQGGHFPTIDLVAARQYGRSETNTTVGTAYTTDYVGVQMNIPLLNGGGVMAQVRQAQAREERVRQVLESTRRKTLAEANRLYSTIDQGIEQVGALKQAVLSGEQAVHGERKGIQAGTRTIVDALDAERRLYESLRDHAVAVYSLANNRLKFLALSGAIDLEAIETVSSWLTTAKR